MTNTRKIVKVEKPRPLKSTSVDNTSVDPLQSVLAEMDLLEQLINRGCYDTTLFSLIVSLCENLKAFHAQLESQFKDQVDKCFGVIRDACSDFNLPLALRYRLLEIIEVRSMNWQPNESVLAYFNQKLSQNEANESLNHHSGETQNNFHYSRNIYHSGNNLSLYSPATPATAAVSATSYEGHQESPRLIATPSPVLAMGDVIRSLGKLTSSDQCSGKYKFRDDFVIRNSDSGKVMGMKGKRVHTIEELSDTIISFKKVASGAFERVIQIIGPSEENIMHAMHLIEGTILRNASPVRDIENTFPSHNSSGEKTTIGASPQHTFSTYWNNFSVDMILAESNGESFVDCFEDYRYTVSHGDDFIRITGSNLNLVKTAKLVLEEYFNRENLEDKIDNIGLLFESKPIVRRSDLTRTIYSPDNGISAFVNNNHISNEQNKQIDFSTSAAPKNSFVAHLRQPIIPTSKDSIQVIENAISSFEDDESKRRRMLFAKTSEQKAKEETNGIAHAGAQAVQTNISFSEQSDLPNTYTRDFLVKCASNPCCHQLPTEFDEKSFWSSTIARKELRYVDSDELLKMEINPSVFRKSHFIESDSKSSNS